MYLSPKRGTSILDRSLPWHPVRRIREVVRILHAPHLGRATGTLRNLFPVPLWKPARASGVVSGHPQMVQICAKRVP